MAHATRGLWGLAFIASIWSAAQAGPVEDADMIRQRLHGWREAFNARDAAGACDLFAPDLVYSVPGVIQGSRERMCDNFRRMFGKPGPKLSYAEPLVHEIAVLDTIGIVRLTWTLTTEADGRTDITTEVGMDIFTRQADGRWSISRFIAF